MGNLHSVVYWSILPSMLSMGSHNMDILSRDLINGCNISRYNKVFLTRYNKVFLLILTKV